MIKKLCIIIVVLVCMCGTAGGFEYLLIDEVSDFEAVGSQTYPAHYGSYVDPVWGTTIRRMTDDGTGPDTKNRPMYPSRSNYMENSDGTLMFMQYKIYTTADGVKRSDENVGSTYDGYGWSDTTANVLYFFDGNSNGSGGIFYKITINTDTWGLTYDELASWDADDFPTAAQHDAYFGEGERAFKKGLIHDEGPISWDSRHWMVSVDYEVVDDGENSLSLFAWVDRDAGGFETPQIIGMGWVPCGSAYSGGISPEGNYMFWRGRSDCSLCDGGGAGMCTHFIAKGDFDGTKANPPDLATDSTLLADSMGYHYTVMYDDLDNEILVTGDQDSGSRDLTYWRFNLPGNANQVEIFDSDLMGGGDSHYVTLAGNATTRHWVAFLPTSSDASDECGYESSGEATIIFIKASATDSKAWAVAHSKSDAISYSSQLFAGGSRDGQYYYFNSSWCQAQDQDVYRVELPTNWWNEIDGVGSDTTATGVKIN